MMMLKTKTGLHLLSEMRQPLRNHLERVDIEVGVEKSLEIDQLISKLAQTKIAQASSCDQILNEIFVLEKYAQLFDEYGKIWFQIAASQFSESWSSLQNAFDLIRLIRRFSNVSVSTIENQLYALETAYPYNIFLSIGAVAERFECSICGKDIDSFDCPHRKGGLYRGQMAYGIVKNITHFDHVSIVEHPVDKRCVICYSNDAPQFAIIRYLGKLFSSKKLRVSNFGGISCEKIKIANPEYKNLGRNNPCYCQSGRKFKKCCIGKTFVEQDHVQILPIHSIIDCADA